MTRITDVFMFAVQNPDYWSDFLSGGDYPEELTEEETKALEAAREHVEGVVAELLHLAGEELSKRLGEKRLPKPRFKAASTKKNRMVSLSPRELEDILYRVEFRLDPNEKADAITLYPALVVKKGSLDRIQNGLVSRSLEHTVDGYHVYGSEVPITLDAEVSALAMAAADQARDLVKATYAIAREPPS